jgi:cyclopropane-fatty-acyl-phospholipid synthase
MEESASRTLSLLDDVFGRVEPRDFAFRLWDGRSWGPSDGLEPRFTVVLKHPGSLRRMFVPPTDLTVGEAYIYDDFDVEGDIEATAELAEPLGVLENDRAAIARYGARLLQLPSDGPEREGRRAARLGGKAHSKKRDGEAVRHHYDVSNDFYSLWLDRNMVYSCAYFARPDEDLDSAQERKLDYICRKLRLKPGERLLDIGCGWGGLAIRAAREYGADVTGITLSPSQAELAERRIAEAGLGDRCRVEMRDYRDVDESRPFDKLVSVGMFEHVGKALLPTYFEKAARLLRPGGVFLNHGISINVATEPSRGPSFSDVYVFPDGELLPIGATLTQAEKAGFEVRDTESLREHYALTLRNWVRRLEDHADEARAVTDDVTYRVWRLFMSFSAHQFESNWLGVYQALLVKPDGGRSGLPLTRGDWYGDR